MAENLVPKIARVLRVPVADPFVKGGVTAYVFASRYDYGELGRMVEKRESAARNESHGRFTIVDAYIALHTPSSVTDDTLESHLAQQITGVYLASLGQSPHWFRAGVTKAVAAQLTPRSQTTMDWNDEYTAAFRRLAAPDDFLTGKSTAEDIESLAHGFSRFLLSDARRFRAIMKSLQEGTAFDTAFLRVYGGNPKDVAVVWARREAQQWQRRR